MYHQLTTLSAYSLLQSMIKIPRYIAAAKKLVIKFWGWQITMCYMEP